MKTWMIPTHNDPLGTVRYLMQSIWEKIELDNILLPMNGEFNFIGPMIIDNPKMVQKFNPFIPLMPSNAAQMVPDLIDLGKRVAAVLRPCELRTLKEMYRRNLPKTDNLWTISIDCLGTVPIDEFRWRIKRKGSKEGFTQEALQFARQGGIVPYRYRAACQICEGPDAKNADINISVLGLPVRQYILISIKNTSINQIIDLDDTLHVDPQLQLQHDRVVTRLTERGRDTRERINKSLFKVLPPDIDALINNFLSCGECRICMDVCPLCENDIPQKDKGGNYHKNDIVDWLVSCSDCGICEQSCPKHYPLTIVFGHIRDLLIQNKNIELL